MDYKTLGKMIYDKYMNEYDCDCDQDGLFRCSRSFHDIAFSDFKKYAENLLEDAVEYAEFLENKNMGIN